MDVGLSAITQCSEADGTCAAMRAEIHLAGMVDQKDAVHYKAVLDLDGNGWSARFRRLLGSSSLCVSPRFVDLDVTADAALFP